MPAAGGGRSMFGEVKLLQAFLNSNSQVNGHTDHGHELALDSAASGGVKGKRSVCRGLRKTSLLRQAKFSQGTANGHAPSNLYNFL